MATARWIGAARGKARRGFTLVELLVVVGVIAILAGVTSTAYLAAMRAARKAQCVNNMRSIALANINYGGDNNQTFALDDGNAVWDAALAPYLGNIPTTQANPVLKCPEDTRPLSSGGVFARSYSFNGSLPVRSVQVTSPSEIILLAEWYTGGTQPPGGAGANFQYGGNYSYVTYGLGASPMHGTVSNFAFVDGHVESLVPNATVTPVSMWK
jgi:prepilin-type N-terminal cleavage/methylation domain-containing protein/prepilin-type processing-associated H-X9-DG protein